MKKEKNIFCILEEPLLEWSKIDVGVKVDLITLIEGVRPSANIELWKLERKKGSAYFQEQLECLDKWLEKSGLIYRENKADYYVCQDQNFLDQLWCGEIKAGEFLGYPECCILNFEEGCQRYLDGKGKGPMVEFGESARKAIQEGTYNFDLDYILHAPCSVNCTESIEMAGKVKRVLILRDKDAAESLRKNNRLFIDP